jgi:hypothetical protein
MNFKHSELSVLLVRKHKTCRCENTSEKMKIFQESGSDRIKYYLTESIKSEVRTSACQGSKLN